MTDDVLEPIEGIDVVPGWNSGEGIVYVSVAVNHDQGDDFQLRPLVPAEARALARHLTLAAEMAESGPNFLERQN